MIQKPEPVQAFFMACNEGVSLRVALSAQTFLLGKKVTAAIAHAGTIRA
jgi:hypothetical protein